MDNQPSRVASRRAVLGAAAWTAPVVLIAGAIPAVAASTPSVDLRSRARIPNEPYDRSLNSTRLYTGVRTLTFTFDFFNDGPDALPAGGIVTIGLPFAAIWGTVTLAADPSGKAPVASGVTSTQISTNPVYYRKDSSFVLGSSVAAGTMFQLTFSVTLSDATNVGTASGPEYIYANFSAAGVATDTNTSNNSDLTDVPVYLNYPTT